jgi:hypothetical protein
LSATPPRSPGRGPAPTVRARPFSELQSLGRQVREGTELNRYESIWECPWCTAAHRKKRRLYYNTRKRRGVCYICGTAVTGGRQTIEELCQDYVSREEGGGPDAGGVLSHWDLTGWSREIEDGDDFARYLGGRGIHRDLQRRYGLRSSESPKRGVVIPNGFDPRRVNFFQIRDIDPHARLRYVNLSCTKPVYAPHCYDREDAFRTRAPEALISEGPLNAISADAGDAYHSLALFSKGMSAYQHGVLRDSPIERFAVNLDPPEVYAILSLARQVLGFRDEVSVVLLPWGKDTNDLIGYFPRFYANRATVTRTGWDLLWAKVRRSGLRPGDEVTEAQWAGFAGLVQGLKRGKSLGTVTRPAGGTT